MRELRRVAEVVDASGDDDLSGRKPGASGAVPRHSGWVMSHFVPGLELSRSYYHEVVRPLLDGVPHDAALIGQGSDVLGFDTERSADHDWGPRALIFVPPELVGDLTTRVSSRLPAVFRGYPTAFGSDRDPVRCGVVVADFGRWAHEQLGFDPRGAITVGDWLGVPWQRLGEVTGGEVFHDGLRELETARERLRWYPDDLWRYVLACQWVRIAQEESFPGRAGEVGDDLGSLLATGRLVRDLMRLSLLMRRRYPPYTKWLGSAFRRLGGSAELGVALGQAMRGHDWRERELHLSTAYKLVAGTHNRLRLTGPLDPSVRPYFDRPFKVIGGRRFADALIASIGDAAIGDLPVTGAVDQFADSADVLTDVGRSRSLARAIR
ncbi:DUF4037 domain-containing protein [Planotetraspora sp. GP83]|uniref:DUF4037 domain-containing protein n=1 Tax=Planotetraspora sp. GP83 TaxID=3156264 RepID=UPI003517F376